MNPLPTTNNILVAFSTEISESSCSHGSFHLFNIQSELIFELIYAILFQYILLNEVLSKIWKGNESFIP